MIKPENLRIGDLVMVSRDCAFPKGTMCTVTQIFPERGHEDKKGVATLSYTDDTDDGPWGAWCCNIEGVPITPEILKQNDFNDKDLGVIFTKTIDCTIRRPLRRISIVRYLSEWGVFLEYESWHDTVLMRSVQYVHELQHILWVLGMNTNLKI